MAGPQYVPRLMTTTWGRALMKTPVIGQITGMFAKGYAGIVASELKKYGLRYEDVMVVTPDIDTALRRMDPYDVDMRNKRLKRAADLSVKHTYLPYELQEKHDPWADTITPMLVEVKKERLERQAIGGQPASADSPAFFFK